MTESNKNSLSISPEPTFDEYGNPTWPYLNLFSWKKLKYKCRMCSWSGDGSQVDIGEVDDSITELVCPACGRYMSALSHIIDHAKFQRSIEIDIRDH